MKRIGIGCTLGMAGTQGVFALNLALQFTRRQFNPVLLSVAKSVELDMLRRRLLMPALQEYMTNKERLVRNLGKPLAFPVLHVIGDRLTLGELSEQIPGGPNIGLVFSNRTDILASNLERFSDWPLLIAGSSWCLRMLRDKGLRNVASCPMGIDPSLFHPAPRAGLFSGRFAVFSGGSSAYRKGHDILIAAFRIFHQRHPDALLVCAWGNSRQESSLNSAVTPVVLTASGPVNGMPQAQSLLADSGIPPQAVFDLGPVPHSQMPVVLRECDLAVFPSRCESGANLYAMEAMACGLPIVISANTGHLDLIGDHLYLLKEQRNPALLTGDPGLDGWGESSVEEVLETMEKAYRKRDEAGKKGREAASFMEAWTWDRQSGPLLSLVSNAVNGHTLPELTVNDDYLWGNRLHRAGQLAEAKRVYDKVLALAPHHINAYGDRGFVRRELGDFAGAEDDFKTILMLDPGHSRALHSLGNLFRMCGKREEAIDCLEQALEKSDYPSLHWDLAYSLLLMGRYRDAWPHFNYRHDALGLRMPERSKPRWDGQAVSNGILLVLDEQGLGDTLQFLRFLPQIPVADGGRVIYAGKPATLPVVRRLLPPGDVFDWNGSLPHSRYWVPLMSLAEYMGVSAPEFIPPPLPNSLAEPERIGRWRPLVRGDGSKPVVALCWRGNPDFSGDAYRSPGLAVMKPILEIEGIRFVSVQVGGGRREIIELGLSDNLADLGGAIEASGADVLDTLAVLESCDYVISSCTSVAHMAGLARRPGLVLLSSRPDWRWMFDRTDSPWYPSLKLIRQQASGDWQGVVADAMKQLLILLDSRRF